jgi:hypothetical protein
MSYTNRLSRDQRRILNMYISQYDQTSEHIESLTHILNDISINIQNIIQNNTRDETSFERNNRTNDNVYINSLINMLMNYQRTANQRTANQRTANQRTANQRTVNQRTVNQRTVNQRTANQRTANQQTANQQTANQRTTNQRTANQRTANQRTANLYYDYERPINPYIYETNVSFDRINQTNNLFENNDFTALLNNFLNTNIIVRPTNEQISNSCRIIKYGDIENPLSDACPISLEHFNNDDNVIQINYCSHIFCHSQLIEWFDTNVHCPVCRYDIRDYIQPSNTRIPQTQNVSNNSNTTVEIPIEPQNNNNSTQNNFSNINVTRDPNTNEIDQIVFDINNPNITDDILHNITTRLFQSLLSSQNTNPTDSDDILSFDASNNILLYETTIRPNNRMNNNLY